MSTSGGMETHYVAGERIVFPYTPYKTQMILINQAIQAIQQGKNALLESPTGTGKSIAILSAILAWKVNHGTDDKKPTVYIASRTHSQLIQLVAELRKSPLHTNVSATIAASRKHYCIHPRISKLADVNSNCKLAVAKSICNYFPQHASLGKEIEAKKNPIMDIEELVNIGRSKPACPYYTMKHIIQKVDIVFCPYNYILNRQMRSQMGISLTENIVVLDEAHNVDDICRDALSFDINIDEIINLTEDLKLIAVGPYGAEHLELLNLFMKLCEWIEEYTKDFKPSPDMNGFDQQTRYFNSKESSVLLDKLKLQEKAEMFRHSITDVAELHEEFSVQMDEPSNHNAIPVVLSSNGLHLIESILNTMLVLVDSEEHLLSFHFAIQRKKLQTTQGSEWEHFFCLWCLDPSIAFSDLEYCRSVIVMSGTLSPIQSFAQELGTTFPFQLEAKHIVPLENTWVEVIGKNAKGKDIIATYEQQDSIELQDSIGDILIDYISRIPDGVVCFFSSYRLLFKLVSRWKNTGKWNAMQRSKSIHIEPQRSDELPPVLDSYYKSIENGRGAILFAVYRGKVSEGINFSDHNARAVIVIGIPFPGLKDPQVILKKEHNTRFSRKKKILSGKDWYSQQAFRALNQALGRCIRHAKDYGAILLLDARFDIARNKNQISKWIRERIKPNYNLKESLDGIKKFFDEKRKLEPKIQYSSSNSSTSLPKPQPQSLTLKKPPSSVLSNMYQMQKKNLQSTVQSPVVKHKLPKSFAAFQRTSSPSLRRPTQPFLDSKPEIVYQEQQQHITPPVNMIKCNNCSSNLASLTNVICKREIHWNNTITYGWEVPSALISTIGKTGIWEPRDGVVYELIGCGTCRHDNGVGLKILATNVQQQSQQNHIILLATHTTKLPQIDNNVKKRKLLENSYTQMAKRVKLERNSQ